MSGARPDAPLTGTSRHGPHRGRHRRRRHWLRVRAIRVVSLGALCTALVLTIALGWMALHGGAADSQGSRDVSDRSSQDQALRSGLQGNVDFSGHGKRAGHLPAATTPPAGAPASVAAAPPLRPHEVFGFAPYWTLSSSGGFDVQGISTLAYFSVDVNPDGTLQQSGAGWNGYESQNLANLITRAHAANDRVVLTVTDFDQASLNALTSSPTAATKLSSTLLGAVSAKNLDGVNLDLEGEGSGDQAGLTRLVAAVSSTLHQANPHYQVTMDTYASSATDSGGFYDIPALAPVVDGFFVMQYSPNLAASSSPTSPLTSGLFSDQTTVNEYASAVPPSKVILGLPYFGIDWPTTNGTIVATATGPATDVSLNQVLTSGHPLYWDPVTDSGWTSYAVGNQWHETFFEDPTSLYDAAQLAKSHNFAGVGIWALGMDGNNMNDLAALDGVPPAPRTGPTGPVLTFPPVQPVPPGETPSSSTTTTSPQPTVTTTTTGSPVSTTTTTPSASTTTTSTTVPSGPIYSGLWNQTQVTLVKVSGAAIPPTQGTVPVGQLTDFATDDPSVSCLSQSPSLAVWQVSGNSSEYLVVATYPADCASADFTFSTS
jgi:Glycosyl hydrolases family 18